MSKMEWKQMFKMIVSKENNDENKVKNAVRIL